MEDIKVVYQILVHTILHKESHHIATRCGYMPLVLLYAEREEIGDICVSLCHRSAKIGIIYNKQLRNGDYFFDISLLGVERVCIMGFMANYMVMSNGEV